MKTKKPLAVFFSLLLFLGCGENGSPRLTPKTGAFYTYTSIPTGTSILIRVAEKQFLVDSHTVIGLKTCAGDDKFVCLIGGGWEFVVPRTRISVHSQWSYQRSTFNVVRKLDGEILGRKYNGFLIVREGSDDYYLYSNELGLIAFGTKLSIGSSSFLVAGRCGYHSARDCV